MKRKLPNITSKIPPIIAMAVILLGWELVSITGIVPSYMLPSPVAVIKALVGDLSTILFHAKFTLLESFYGLLIGIALAFVFATVMDRFRVMDQAFYPIMIITQTIPTIAIAPILVLWMGFGMAPKITLVVLTTFFPITIGLLDGYKSVDVGCSPSDEGDGGQQGTDFSPCEISRRFAPFFFRTENICFLCSGRCSCF